MYRPDPTQYQPYQGMQQSYQQYPAGQGMQQPYQQHPADLGILNDYYYPQNLPQALRLISEATAGETEDRMFYQYLINTAKSTEDKEIIRGIQENEIKHFALFRQIYTDLTGQVLPPPGNVTFEQPTSYCAGIKKAIQGELNAVVRYRKILFAMQYRPHINMLTEIITDELRHASLYNYIYARNGCKD